MFYDKLCRIKGYILYICAFCFIFAFFVLLLFAFAKTSMTAVTPKICVADFMCLLGGGNFINLAVIPLCSVFITILADKNCTGVNYYIRNKSRTSIILKRIKKIFIFSFVLSFLALAISAAVGGLFTAEIINWTEYDSYSFVTTQVIWDISFIKVLLLTFAELVFPVIFFSCLLFTLSLACKKTFAFIIVVLVSGLNPFGFLKYFIDYTFNYNFSEVTYLSFSSVVLIFGVFPLLILLTVLAAVKLVKRKDVLN